MGRESRRYREPGRSFDTSVGPVCKIHVAAAPGEASQELVDALIDTGSTSTLIAPDVLEKVDAKRTGKMVDVFSVADTPASGHEFAVAVLLPFTSNSRRGVVAKNLRVVASEHSFG